MRVCNMVKKVGMKSVPPVVKETGLLFRNCRITKLGKPGPPHKPLPIRTMEIKTAVRNKTNIYCNLNAKTFKNNTFHKGKIGEELTNLIQILRAKIKAIVAATLNDPKEKNKTWVCKSRHRTIKPFEARPVRMPVFPPGANPGVDSYRTVKLYIVDNRQVWLHRNDLEWALRYLFLEIYPRWRMGEDSRGHAPIPWWVEAP